MSKRSGMSRWQDLRRGFVDIGRFRYVLNKFDMEKWKDQVCFGCGKPFVKEPHLFIGAYPVHDISNPDDLDDCFNRGIIKYNDMDRE